MDPDAGPCSEQWCSEHHGVLQFNGLWGHAAFPGCWLVEKEHLSKVHIANLLQQGMIFLIQTILHHSAT
jgi:hypothetical protein